ncbi:hypothetical protein EAH89_17215 [Roseomonas nepalensis]|uniref:NusG-like N-terminal domain-containing protein n=1 Tax=Muricoccus nepalensis TaxID=1854500 RepID=A0A502FUM7_9PROT|nr:transcription termination/antitermination NusG family protein [Roseomonas nepalensis]TPG53258.1 hypothetical protein EAH89_17215 [Roseomonas nepalensis]
MARIRSGPFPPTRAQLLDAARREALKLAVDSHSGADMHLECGSHSGPRWFCLQSHLGAERLAAREAREQNFTIFVPSGIFYRGRRFVAAPLVPRYLFAAFDPETAPWRRLMHTRGVHRLFLNGDRPAPARRGTVEKILDHVEAALAPTTGPVAEYSSGDKVQIQRGPYAGFTPYVQWADAAKVGLRLRMFGREVDVEMLSEDVRLVAP